MNDMFKFLWRVYKSLLLKRNNVRVSPYARFSKSTTFEQNIVVHKKAVVSGSHIGRNTYIGENSIFHNCYIGRFCSISSDVKVVVASHPSSVYVSTCPSFFSVNKQNGQSFVHESVYEEHLKVDGFNVIVGNDVWIGSNVLIKGGIRIGDGAIIAMGSVVTKDVPPYAIVGGVPAKQIRLRFSEEQIEELIKIKWWDKSDDWFYDNASRFDDINHFLKSKY